MKIFKGSCFSHEFTHPIVSQNRFMQQKMTIRIDFKTLFVAANEHYRTALSGKSRNRETGEQGILSDLPILRNLMCISGNHSTHKV